MRYTRLFFESCRIVARRSHPPNVTIVQELAIKDLFHCNRRDASFYSPILSPFITYLAPAPLQKMLNETSAAD